MAERAPAPGGLALIETLVNTLDLESGVDSLDTDPARAALGLVDASAAELADARELRESLRAVCLVHGGHPPVPATPLDRLLAAAPLVVTVDPDGSAALRPVDPGSLVARVAAAIAAAAADGTWPRLKACEAADCHWAYYDRSPAGRSRWCSMAVCGSRAKMRAYRAARRT
ncbi:CGNR zinc finger domain-containing protein [Streptomyces sp. NPDC020719]|uniref:CGNR zinc finger domain-containing protein n=1 Tax=unclassified Streptomyces TaxID=2593676 RepID=UPI0033CEC6AB